MKTYLLSLITFLFSISIYAQTDPLEAKAAYLMAEESYGKGDYSAAMDYLQQVKKSLGTTNCKILFLEIMVSRELFVKDFGGMDKILELITAFEKSSDYPDFTEEKKIDISKLKLTVRSEYKNLKDKLASEAAENSAKEYVFNKEFARFGPLGISLSQFDSLHPELNVKEWKMRKAFGTYTPQWVSIGAGLIPSESAPFCAVRKGSEFIDKIAVIDSRDEGRYITGYKAVLVYIDNEKEKETLALNDANTIIDRYRRNLRFEPIITEYTLGDRGRGHWTAYTWKRGNKVIELHKLNYPSGRSGIVKLIESIHQ